MTLWSGIYQAFRLADYWSAASAMMENLEIHWIQVIWYNDVFLQGNITDPKVNDMLIYSCRRDVTEPAGDMWLMIC